MRALDRIATARLELRRPGPGDAPTIFAAYPGDPEVTRLLGWPRHRTVADSEAFVAFSDAAWEGTGVGPYLVRTRDGRIVGSTGLEWETPYRASTGFVLARAVWGRGYATELAMAMVDLADGLGIVRLAALCHLENRASARVLAKAGFAFEGVLRRHTVFPNLGPDPRDVECWARTVERVVR